MVSWDQRRKGRSQPGRHERASRGAGDGLGKRPGDSALAMVLSGLLWVLLVCLAPASGRAQSGEDLALTNEIRATRSRLKAQEPSLAEAELDRRAYTLGRSNYLGRAIETAVRRNDLTEAERLLKDFPGTVDDLNNYGQSLLYQAVQAGNEAHVRFMLEHKADPNRKQQQGDTLVCVAIRFQRWPLAVLLLDAGASATQTNLFGWGESPLGLLVNNLWGIAGNDPRLEVLNKLLEHGANPLSPWGRGEAGSIVERTLAQGLPNGFVGDLLLTNKAEPALRTAAGDTALHLAARWGRTNALEALLARGFPVNQTNNDGLTPLQCIADSARQPVMVVGPAGRRLRIVPPYSGPSPFGWPAAATAEEVVDFLLQHGATLDVFSAAALGRTNEVATMLREEPALARARDGLGRTPLHYAVNAQQPFATRLLLRSGADVNARTSKQVAGFQQQPVIPAGSSALHIAAQRGDWGLLHILLQAGAQPAPQDQDGNTPLHVAARQYSTNCLGLLVAAHAPLETTNSSGSTPLRVAVEFGGPELVELLLRAGARPTTGLGGDTLMHLAAERGSAEIVTVLLRHGQPLEPRDSQGRTPFERAAERRQFATFSLLQSKGADVNATDSGGDSALHLVAGQQDDTFGRWAEQPLLARWKQAWLAQPGWRFQALNKLLQWKVVSPPPPPTWTNCSVTEWLLEHGARPNLTNRLGQTPLHALCEQSWLPYSNPPATNRVAVLLRAGAKAEWPDARGLTSLHVAVSNAPAAVVSLLARAVTHLDSLRDAEGRTPLHYAMHRSDGASEIVTALLAAGLSPDVIDQRGRSPLHEAVASFQDYWSPPRLGVLLTLLTNHANASLADRDGLTPLHVAMQTSVTNYNFNLREIVPALLAHGAQPNPRDARGRTPLHWLASATGQYAHLEREGDVLLSGGWDFAARDRDGQTPIHLWAANLDAACSGCSGVLRNILTNQALVNLTNGAGDTPLQIAIRSNRYYNARVFMESGADPKLRNLRGESALRLVASLMPGNVFEQAVFPKPGMAGRGLFNSLFSRDRTSLERWLEADPTLASVTNASGQTPLLIATERKDADLTQRLLKLGAPLDLLSAMRLGRMDEFHRLLASSHTSPPADWLFEAVRFGRGEALGDLVRAGGRVGAVDADGHSLLYRARLAKQADIAEWLRAQGTRETLFDAVVQDDQARVQEFLEADASGLNATNGHGRTPLLAAVGAGQQELAIWLLERGADKERRTGEGWTALHLAAARSLLEIGRKLLDAKADPNQLASGGMGPLHIAAAFGHTDFVALLLERGADVNLRPPDSNGSWQNTPLHWAAHRGHAETVKLLLAHGAEPKITNKSGATRASEVGATERGFYRGFPMPTEAWSPGLRTPTPGQRAAVLALLDPAHS